MVKQTRIKSSNTSKDWRLLAERDFSVQPRYDLGVSLSEEDSRLVLEHTITIRDFLRKEIPGLFG